MVPVFSGWESIRLANSRVCEAQRSVSAICRSEFTLLPGSTPAGISSSSASGTSEHHFSGLVCAESTSSHDPTPLHQRSCPTLPRPFARSPHVRLLFSQLLRGAGDFCGLCIWSQALSSCLSIVGSIAPLTQFPPSELPHHVGADVGRKAGHGPTFLSAESPSRWARSLWSSHLSTQASSSPHNELSGARDSSRTRRSTEAWNVIHTVGPIARGTVGPSQSRDLRSCYETSLRLMEENKLHSVVSIVTPDCIPEHGM
ncbi:hypothetical protein P4O66_002072 [Electrophorus voltai]|uniref:Macro domain-containing protein n=1 Tax=Electrophorus voltai TaxID=2609070 RepID=A0AAD8Z3X2_9TELE|nr:hypothetical protein P4O66_002072 [Electrophorus voltai]